MLLSEYDIKSTQDIQEALKDILGGTIEDILNAFESRYSNGYTEGINNSVKAINRVGFGYRNFDMLRKKMLMLHREDIFSPAHAQG